MTIRSASPQDAKSILGIYAHYVERTAVSFECEVPSCEEFGARIAATLKRYPYIVAEADGVIQGYAYAGPLKEREAYDRSCEVTIYVSHNARRRGWGRILYEVLERRLRALGILNLYACIAVPIGEDEYLTRDSERFHTRMGYKKAGEFHKCGHKFGHWYDVVWMEKFIGTHDKNLQS